MVLYDVIGIVGSICFNNLPETNQAILNEGTRAIEFAITLAGVMALWMGIMNIAKDSGLIDKIAKKMSPINESIISTMFHQTIKQCHIWL